LDSLDWWWFAGLAKIPNGVEPVTAVHGFQKSNNVGSGFLTKDISTRLAVSD
jgi:uncharacterized membrane protein